MKNVTIAICFFFLGYLKCIACDCDTPKAILEFYSSKYVFKGIITSKTFSKDSATYTIKFKVLESYKKGKIPKELSFTSNYKKDDAKWSNCYREEYQYQEWLVFAHENGGNLGFSGICSNSQFLRGKEIDPYMQKILDNANNFNLTDYIYYDYYEGGSKFNYTKVGTNIDTVFENGTIKDYQDTYTILALFIDEKGKLISVFTGFDVINSEPQLKYNSVFGLLSEFNVTSKRPLNDFEIDAINLIKLVKDWEVKAHNITKVPVKYIHYIHIEYDAVNRKWKYEY